jgi:large conductance mechanosensitive channel
MLDDFRKFVMRGNVVDLAVGVIIGAAFGAIVTSLVSDLVMPPIGLAVGDVDFSDLFVVLRQGTPPPPYPTLEAAKAAGAVTLNYGAFITVIINFLIVAAAIFLVIRAVERLHRKEAAAPPPSMKECPFCFSQVPLRATRCPACTSQL